MNSDANDAGDVEAGDEKKQTETMASEQAAIPQAAPRVPYPHPPPPPPPAPAAYTQYTYSERRQRKKEESNKPTVVAALLILVAILGLAFSAMGLVGFSIFEGFDDASHDGFVTIRGEVNYVNDTGVDGATVSVVGEALSTVTDSEGNYIIYGVPVGDQRIQVEKEGYKTIIRKITLTEVFDFENLDQTKETRHRLDFTLQAGTGSVEVGSHGEEFPIEDFRTFMMACSVIGVLMSILALWGGWNALKRQNVTWVMVGCVAGIFSIGFGIGAILAFVALFVTLLGMDEFKRPKATE
jgi:hypothetical protein